MMSRLNRSETDANNNCTWEPGEKLCLTILAPEKTPYEGGLFELMVTHPELGRSPEVRFVTEIWHPNIVAGAGGFRILKKLWLPSFTLESVVATVESLLESPDLSDSANPSAWEQFAKRRRLFDRTARFWTSTFAGRAAPDRELAWKTRTLLRRGFSLLRAVQLLSAADWEDEKIGALLSSDLGHLKDNK